MDLRIKAQRKSRPHVKLLLCFKRKNVVLKENLAFYQMSVKPLHVYLALLQILGETLDWSI